MAKASTKKMRDHRDRLRARGFRPVQLWVADTRNPRVKARLRRQARALSRVAPDARVERLLDDALRNIEGWTA